MPTSRSRDEPEATSRRLGRRRALRVFGAVAAAAAVAFKLGSINATALGASPNTVITDEYVDLKGLVADPALQEGRVAFRADLPDFRVSRNGTAWTSLEVTERKGAPNGYADLDVTSKVPVNELGTGTANSNTFLRGDRSWASPPAAVAIVSFLAWNKFAVD